MHRNKIMDSSLNSSLQGCAAFWMTIGQGAAEGFYFATNGYYMQAFADKTFFLSMLLCLTGPKPIVSWLQQSFDAYFDERLSTEVTYVFRVIGMQIGLALLILLWMFTAVRPSCVLLIGFLLGMLGNAIVSSSLQMSAAMAPDKILTAKIGIQVGGLVTVVVTYATQFTPDSSLTLFRAQLFTVQILCVMSACILGAFHVNSNIFTKAYKRLAYDLNPSLGSISESDELLSDGSMMKQETEDQGLNPDADTEGVPAWVSLWQACSFVLMAISMYILSLSGFFQNAGMAQTLALIKLAMEFVGRIAGIAAPCFPSFEHGPFHKLMLASFVVAVSCGAIVLTEVFVGWRSRFLFYLSWATVFAIGIFATSLADVTTAAYAPAKDRKQIARTNQMVIVSGQLLGLILSTVTSDMIAARSVHNDAITIRVP